MSIANHKGGFSTTLRVTQNNKNETLCMLDKPFLKKAENWSLQVTDFFINKVQALNLELGEQLRIVPYYPLGFHAGWKESDYKFTPKNCYTVLEYAIQLQDFFRRFSFLFWKFGVNVTPQGVTIAEGLTVLQKVNLVVDNFDNFPINYVKKNIVPDDMNIPIDEGYGVLESDSICKCFLDNQMKINIKLFPIFLANFFIDCTGTFERRLDMHPYIYAIAGQNAVIRSGRDPETPLFDEASNIQANGYLQFHAGVLFAVANFQLLADTYDFPSKFTIREIDDRLSLDVICTFPASRKLFVLDGKEDHEYLLARFDLSSYKEFEAVSIQDDERMLQSNKITESFMAGIHNLTLNNPDYESNLLLPGAIHQIHLMLYTRYLQDNKIVSVKTDLTDGFWHVRMLFSKKI